VIGSEDGVVSGVELKLNDVLSSRGSHGKINDETIVAGGSEVKVTTKPSGYH
jgi:hypothetical protein